MASNMTEINWRTQGLGFVSPVHDTYPFISAANADLRGKSVLITGASRGVGQTTAAHFARAGCSVIALAARSSLAETEKAIEKAAEEGNHAAPRVLCLRVDVTSIDSVRRAAEEVEEAFGGSLDVLINNAGYLPAWELIGDGDPLEYWKTWQVNINGTYLPCRYFLPLLLKSQLKTVINLSSGGAQSVTRTASSYQTTKFAICRFTEFLVAEYQDQGLLAYNLHPGAIQTDLALNMPTWMHDILVDTPQMAADTMVWLCKERREWLSGRFVSAAWNMQELEGRKDEIVQKGLLKFRMTL